MIINGQRVQGLFIYNSESSSIEFTKNDLVVSGDNIYICNVESISGIDPATDTSFEYYQPYPGSKIITASEFFTYVKNGREVDKYVSSQAIKGILQGYQFGLDMEGVITDWIDKNGDTTLILSSPTDRPLDNLMLTETLNRGMVKVSHELSQIVDGTVSDKSFSTIFGFLEKEGVDYQLLLSQYTYKSSSTMYVRVQEMTSPLTGVSVYRYMTWESGSFPSDGNVISGWRNVFSYSSAIKSKLDALQDYYVNLARQRKAQVDALVGSFRFREVYSGGNSVTGLESGIYTVCVRGIDQNQHYISESVVVKVGDTSYDLYLNNISGHLSITSSSITLTDSDASIVSIYSREEKI